MNSSSNSLSNVQSSQFVTKISEKVIVDSGHRQIKSKTFKLADNQTAEYHIMVSNTKISVIVILECEPDKFVVVRQFRPGPEIDTIEFPGGGASNGEDPRVAAARELEEETGYSVQPENLVLLGSYFGAAYQEIRFMAFYANQFELKSKLHHEPGEFTKVETIDKLSLEKYVQNNSGIGVNLYSYLLYKLFIAN